MACSNVSVSPADTSGEVWHVVMCVCLFHLQIPVVGMAGSNVCVSVSPADTSGEVWHVVMCVCLFHLQIPLVGYGR